MFKKFISFFFCFLILSGLSVFSQETLVNEENTGLGLTLNEVSDEKIKESEIPINSNLTTGENTETSGVSGIWLFFRMFLVLLFVILLIYAFIWFLKKTSKTPETKDDYIRHTAAIALGSGKSVHIITVGEDAFLLGASENSVSLISKLEDKDLIQAMNLAYDERVTTKKTFTDILSSYITGVTKKDNNGTEKLSSLTDKIKSTRSRFNKMDDSDEKKS